MQIDDLLKWALPRLGFRWEGFKNVVGQVESRVRDRMVELGIGSYEGYQEYLQAHSDEWDQLDACCRITISRFYRDPRVLDALRPELPRLAEDASSAGRCRVRAWSAGAASGEEAYTLAACWQFDLAEAFPDLAFRVIGSEADPHMLDRAERGVYPDSSLEELPEQWHKQMFAPHAEGWRLRDGCRSGVEFVRGDIRDGPPEVFEGPLDLVACRYLAFTYFDHQRQRSFLDAVDGALRTGGLVVIGEDEDLPNDDLRFETLDETSSVFVKVRDDATG